MLSRPIIRIAVVDYQRCAFAPENFNDEHFLSHPLLEFISSQKYNYFFGHTFRCVANSDELRELLEAKVPVSEQDKFKQHSGVADITRNIHERTALPCLQVATLDDLVNNDLGTGYKDLEDYETYQVTSQNPHVEQSELLDYMSENNKLLLLIAKYCENFFFDQAIELDIYDDNELNNLKALSADKQAKWPATVKVNKIYQYNAKLKNEVVVEVTPDGILLKNSMVDAKPILIKDSQRRVSFADDHVMVMNDTQKAAAVLVKGTVGTFQKPPLTEAVPSIITPRRSERLASKMGK